MGKCTEDYSADFARSMCGGTLLHWLIGFVLMCCLVVPNKLAAADTLEDGRAGRIVFASVTPAGALTLPRRIAAGLRPATISGDLILPTGDRAGIPAMVIAHGSGGVGEHHRAWARFFVDRGIAAFVVDSFTERGIRETATNQSALDTWANVADALKALALLATHPRIDPNRIGVIGGSRGGQVALYTAFEEVASGLLTPGMRFAVHFALYPACMTRYVGVRPSHSPIHVLLGGSDDYTPHVQCMDYVTWFKEQGAKIEAAIYSGAHHGFDRSDAPSWIVNIQNFAPCYSEYDMSTATMRKLPNREVMTRDESQAYYRNCWKRGAHVGGDAKAREAARNHVLQALKALGWF